MFARLSCVGIFNSFLFSIALLSLIVVYWRILQNLDGKTNSNITDNQFTHTVRLSHKRPSTKSFHRSNSSDIDKYLSSFSQSTLEKQDCIVFLTTYETVNATIGAIYNMREPVLGNWTKCIVVLGHQLKQKSLSPTIHSYQKSYIHQYFTCLNAFLFDITDDSLKDSPPLSLHVHYWKNYILLHPFFRQIKRWRYILYLDSDVITVRAIEPLIHRTISYMKSIPSMEYKYIWCSWREDYRHGSMYRAVLDLKTYSAAILLELQTEYPDYEESKQGNVMLFVMDNLPNAEYIQQEIDRLYNKYGEGFRRNDQSLFNLLLYRNSTDLGWSAFTHPPSEDLFYPPTEYFPMIHTGGHEAMYLRRPKQFRGGIKRADEKAWYHALWEFWMYKLYVECPKV